jgi:hypothetical protein
MKKKNSVEVMLRYIGIGFLISSIKTNFIGLSPLEVTRNFFLLNIYNLFVGVWIGLAALFGNELYFFLKPYIRQALIYLKKNFTDERRIYRFRNVWGCLLDQA